MACERRQKPGPHTHTATQPAAQPASQPGQARQVETGQGGRERDTGGQFTVNISHFSQGQ